MKYNIYVYFTFFLVDIILTSDKIITIFLKNNIKKSKKKNMM